MVLIKTQQQKILILVLLLSLSILPGCMPASYSLTTQELTKQWLHQGPLEIQRKYVGKTIELSGIVASKNIARDTGEATLLLYENSPAQLLITVSFPLDKIAELSKLKQGNFITVKGTFYEITTSHNGWNTMVIRNDKLME